MGVIGHYESDPREAPKQRREWRRTKFWREAEDQTADGQSVTAYGRLRANQRELRCGVGVLQQLFANQVGHGGPAQQGTGGGVLPHRKCALLHRG